MDWSRHFSRDFWMEQKWMAGACPSLDDALLYCLWALLAVAWREMTQMRAAPSGTGRIQKTAAAKKGNVM